MFQPPTQNSPRGQLVREEQYVPPQFLPTPNSPFVYNPVVSTVPAMSEARPSTLQKPPQGGPRPASSSSFDSGCDEDGAFIVHQADEPGNHSTIKNEIFKRK